MCCGHVSLLAVSRQCQCKREVEDWSAGGGGEQQNPSNRDSTSCPPYKSFALSGDPKSYKWRVITNTTINSFDEFTNRPTYSWKTKNLCNI